MRLTTGIVRDDRYLEHKTGHIHPDHPNRLRAVYRILDAEFAGAFVPIGAEPAPLEYLELVHTPFYIEKVLKTADHDFTSLAPDTPASALTYLAAWLAVGGCINGLEALLANRCQVCFCLVRPPGHHALPDRAGGFCVFNNMAITARYAMNYHGFRRILIIDWDIHHGNGIQELFYGEKEVLYFSTHDTLLYPYTGDRTETGTGAGQGYTVNLPLPRELDNREFLYLYQEVLGPIVRGYQPELILVSAGFDAHRRDPIGQSRLNEQAFQWLTELLLGFREEIGEPPLLLALEGGYDPRSLANSVRAVLRALTRGPDRHQPLPGEKTRLSAKLVRKVREIHRKYGIWAD